MDTADATSGKTGTIWPLIFAPFVGVIYYLTFQSAFLQSMDYVKTTQDQVQLIFRDFWIPTAELIWGERWIYRLFAEGSSIALATFISGGIARERARTGAILGGIAVALLASVGAFAIFVLGGTVAAIEPWYQNWITASLIVAAPFIGWIIGEYAREISTATEKGFVGVPRGHFVWLWIIFWFYALSLIAPIINLYLYYWDNPHGIGTVFGGILRGIPILAYGAPLYFGLLILSGERLANWNSAIRQICGVVTLVGGFFLVATIHTILFEGLSGALQVSGRTMTFPVCTREHYWELDVEMLLRSGEGWVRRETPLRFKTVCGLSGSGDDFVVMGPGPDYDEGGRLISTDTLIPGETVEAKCLEEMPPFYDENGTYAWRRPYVWAREPGGFYCELKPG